MPDGVHGRSQECFVYEIKSLGGIEVRDSSGDLVRLRSKKHVALLLYLAGAGRRLYARDSLTRLLWTTSLERARHSLSQAIYDLRQNMPGSVTGSSGDSISVGSLEHGTR